MKSNLTVSVTLTATEREIWRFIADKILSDEHVLRTNSATGHGRETIVEAIDNFLLALDGKL